MANETMDYKMYSYLKEQLEKLDNKNLYYVGIVGGVSVVALYASHIISSIPIVNVASNLVGFYVIVKYLLSNQKVITKKVKDVFSTAKDSLVDEEVEDEDEDIKGYKIVRRATE